MKLIRRKSWHISALSSLILASGAAGAATIVVDGRGCDLPSAILAANTDTPVGKCLAGSGSDVIDIQAKVTLQAVYAEFPEGWDGLPAIEGKLTINGHNHQIVRSKKKGTPNFRIFHVSPGANLTLNEVYLRFGYALHYGGAVFNESGGKLTINRSTIAKNHSDSMGGAIGNFGEVVVKRSTIANNKALYGGGIGGVGYGDPNPLIMVNSTLSGNRAVYGSAIDLVGPGQIRLTHVTITGNDAKYGSAAFIGHDIQLSLQNTVIANSPDENGRGGYDCYLSYQDPAQDLGGNLIEHDAGCQASGFPDGTDPKLSQMAMYGGPTPTHLPMNGSPLLETAGCVVNADQRGSKRARNQCDIGAVGVYRPMDTLFIQFDGKLAKGKLQGIGKTAAEKTKRVKNYRKLLVSARNGKIEKNRALMCGKLQKAYKRLDRDGKIKPSEWITGKASATYAAKITRAQLTNRCK